MITRYFVYFFIDFLCQPRFWLHEIYLSDILENFGPVPELVLIGNCRETDVCGINAPFVYPQIKNVTKFKFTTTS